MRKIATSFLAMAGAVMLLAPAGSVSAHHAFSAEFDANRPLQLTGTVARTEWINPHSWIHVDVTAEDGAVTTWAIECGAPNSLMRRGLNKNSIPVGTELVIDGFRAKDGSRTANARHHLPRRVALLRRVVRHRRTVRTQPLIRRSSGRCAVRTAPLIRRSSGAGAPYERKR